MFGIRVVPLNFLRARESIPFGRRQLDCRGRRGWGGTSGGCRPQVQGSKRLGRAGKKSAKRLMCRPCVGPPPQHARAGLGEATVQECSADSAGANARRQRVFAVKAGPRRPGAKGGTERSSVAGPPRGCSYTSGGGGRRAGSRRTPMRRCVSLWLRMNGLSRFLIILTCCAGGPMSVHQRECWKHCCKAKN